MAHFKVRPAAALSLLLLLLAVPRPSLADLAATVARDLFPLDARIALVRDQEVFLNKGESAGVRTGDLFTVFAAGERLRDPDTGKDLGPLTEPVALVQVVKLRATHAVCTPVLALETLSRGLTAVRFKEIPSLMILESDSRASRRLATRVKLALPKLSWLAEEPGDRRLLDRWDPDWLRQRGAGMAFVLSREGLTLFDRLGQPVRSWLMETGGLNDPGPDAAGPPATALPGSAAPGAVIAPAAGVENVATLDAPLIGMEVADMDGNGRPDLLYLTPSGLGFRPDMAAQREIFHEHRGMGELVNFSVGANGLVALNVYRAGRRMASRLLRINVDRFEAVADNINYILGFVDMGSGRREVLLGQPFDRETFFGAGVVRFEAGPGGFDTAAAVDVPRDFRLTAAAFHGTGTVFINDNHKLVVGQNGKAEWLSTRSVGGAVKRIFVNEGTEKFGIPRAVHIETPPLVLSGGGGDVELLVVVNEGVGKAVVDGFADFASGTVFHVGPSSLGRRMTPATAPLEGAVQGLSLFDGVLYCGLVRGGVLESRAESRVVAVPFPGRAD